MESRNQVEISYGVLPVEERALIADSLLRSLNVPDAGVDSKWKEVAKRRHEELRSGKVKPVPGDEVFICDDHDLI